MKEFVCNLRALACMVIVLALSSCAATPEKVVEDTTPWQTISIHTPGVTGANCFLQTGYMSYPMQAPGKVNIRKDQSPMNVTCFKGEHMMGEQKINPVCANCGYPNSVTVAMSLDHSSFDRTFRIQ